MIKTRKGMLVALLVGVGLLVLAAGCAGAQPTKPAEQPAGPVTKVQPGTLIPMDVDPKALAGVGETPKPGGTLRRNVLTDTLGWDQARTTSTYTYQQLAMVYATLLSLANDPSESGFKRANGQLIRPWFAESWEQKDDLTYVFHLRKGVKFKENAYTRKDPVVKEREATCADVKNTIERQQSTKTGNPETAYRLADIKTVECTDPYTAVLKLKAPFRTLLVNLTYQPTFVLAKEVQDKYGDYIKADTAIGFGPFTLEEATPNVRYVYRKNPDFFMKGKPYVEWVEAQVIADAATQLAALRTGKLDQGTVAVAQLDSLMKSNPEMYYSETLTTSGGYWVAMKTDRPPFNDIRVRQALIMAVDWKAFDQARNLGRGYLNAAFGPGFPEYFLPFEEWPADVQELYGSWKGTPPNIAKAKQLLADAGYPDGFKTAINGTPGYGQVPLQDQQFVAAAWEKIGVKADIKLKEYGAFMATTFIGDFEGIGGPSPYHGYLDPNEYLYFMYYPGMLGNLGNVDDPKLNEMLEKQLRMKYGSPESLKLIKEIQAYTLKTSYRFHSPNANSYAAWHPWVKNWGQVNAGAPGCGGNAGPYYSSVWLDDNAPGRQYVPIKG